MTDSKAIWIHTGYTIFALAGRAGLKIEVLAKKAGINKSSFYHHFADLEIFIDQLQKHHIQQAHIIADKERSAEKIDPDLIDILVEHKMDLLFNRQLRIDRDNKDYAETVALSNRILGNTFVVIWAKDLQLNLTQKQLEGLFELALENFFLQITPDNLHKAWLAGYFDNLKRIARNFS
jgi:AcrR family transcriptional regulator